MRQGEGEKREEGRGGKERGEERGGKGREGEGRGGKGRRGEGRGGEGRRGEKTEKQGGEGNVCTPMMLPMVVMTMEVRSEVMLMRVMRVTPPGPTYLHK